MNGTRYLRKKLGDHAAGKAAWTMPTTVYLALFTADPTDQGSLVNEVTGGAYARQAITATMAAFDSVTGQSVNSAEIAFPTATAAYGTVTHLGIMDALTSGNMLQFGPAQTVRLIALGDRYIVAPGQLLMKYS